jgi:hypothetical protein
MFGKFLPAPVFADSKDQPEASATADFSKMQREFEWAR